MDSILFSVGKVYDQIRCVASAEDIYIYVLYIHICMILLFYSFFPFYLQYIAIKQKPYFQNISTSQYAHRLPMNFPPFQRRALPGNP